MVQVEHDSAGSAATEFNQHAIDRQSDVVSPSRSSFILVGLAGVSAVIGLVFFVSTARFMQRSDQGGHNSAPERVPLVDLHFDASGVSEPIQYDMGDSGLVNLFILRRGRGYLALEQTCTHLGCPVIWHVATGRFDCPCHGSVFDRNGSVVQGPAPYGLYRHRLRIEPGALVVEGRV